MMDLPGARSRVRSLKRTTKLIDDHPTEIRAMELFRSGESKEARRLQTAFLDEVEKSGEDHCACPSACKYHGDCVRCVIIHRGHGDHLPHCFQQMVNRRLDALSALTEHSYRAEPEKA